MSHRTVAGSGCPACARRKRASGLPDARPDPAAQWHPARNDGLTAEAVTAGSHRLVWWKCTVCAGEFRAKVFHRVCGIAACPSCSGRVRYQALSSESPEVAVLWHPSLNGALTPAEVTAGANVRVWWLCPAGHEHTVPAKGGVRRRSTAGPGRRATRSTARRPGCRSGSWMPAASRNTTRS